MNSTDELYPLRFKEILRNYGFGDRWMVEAFAKEGLPDDHRVAETWEVCDRPGESGVVSHGSLSGKSLHELIGRYGVKLLGSDVVARCGTRFPLLIKFLDASLPLGEQVHQNDELAKRQGLDDPGKTEAWYMLKVRGSATIHCGNRDGVTRDEVLKALVDGTVRECMQERAVQPGDAFLLYAGTMHYSHGGVLFYEIMQNSDVIIGLMSRGPRPSEEVRTEKAHAALEGIHIEDGFDCQTRPVTLQEGKNRRTFALACQHFALERLDLTEAYPLDCDGERFYVLSQIEGESTLIHGQRRETLRPGNSCLLPASLGRVIIEPHGPASLLKAYVPDLVGNVVEPLRAAGIPDRDIAALGGRTALNPLSNLLSLSHVEGDKKS
jgi:mannose-6-phosphate isomerase